MTFKTRITRQNLQPIKSRPVTLGNLIIDSASNKPVVLVMKHAGETNRPYINAKRRVDSTLKSNSGPLQGARFRELLIPIFARHVIVGWENVVEDDGTTPPCTPEKIEEFLSFLASDEGGGADIVEFAMGFAFEANNFRDAPIGDARDLGNE